jgi:hypothetical protein
LPIAELLRAGLPFDYINELDETELLAWQVALGTLEGGEFDWSRMAWREQSR